MYIKQSKSLLALLEAALVRIISFRPFCTASTICCTLSKHSKYIVEYCYLSTWIEKQPPFSNFMFQFLKLRSSACTKTAAPTWFAAAIWTLLLFWPTVARSGRLDDVIDKRSFTFTTEILDWIQIQSIYTLRLSTEKFCYWNCELWRVLFSDSIYEST